MLWAPLPFRNAWDPPYQFPDAVYLNIHPLGCNFYCSYLHSTFRLLSWTVLFKKISIKLCPENVVMTHHDVHGSYMSICFISIRHHKFSQTCHSWTKTKWNVSVHFDIEKYDWTDNVTTFQVNTPEWKKKYMLKFPWT